MCRKIAYTINHISILDLNVIDEKQRGEKLNKAKYSALNFIYHASIGCFLLPLLPIKPNNELTRMKGGGGLIYAVGFTTALALLTCALTPNANLNDDPIILQVTDNHHLLGTAAEHQFKSFIQEFGKEYPTREEYLHRLGVFAKNLIRAVEHQAMDPTAVHGVTQFSDLSAEEFERMYMGVKGGATASPWENDVVAEEMEVGGLPESFDWREKGAVTEVKTQVKLFILLEINLYRITDCFSVKFFCTYFPFCIPLIKDNYDEIMKYFYEKRRVLGDDN